MSPIDTYNVVLVNPPLTTEERYGVHFRSGGMTPPLGLACLAAILIKHGAQVKIVDGALSDYDNTVNDIANLRPDYVGITASTVSIHNAAQLAGMIKKRIPVTTIIGGPHVTALPVDTLEKFPVFDVGVIGEADYTITELLDTLAGRQDLSEVKGIVFRRDGNVVLTARRPFTTDLDELPIPAWYLLPDLDKFYCPPVHTVRRLPAALLVTSRGCPSTCKFCDRSIFGNELRANSAEYVVDMMKDLQHRYGIREFQFRDDNFLAYRHRLVELCHLLLKEKLDVSWSIAGRIDMVNPEVLALLAGAGCWQVWYGVESGSQRVLDFINKRTKLEKIKEAIKMTKDAGLDVGGFFMLGLPTETADDIEATIRFSRELELNDAHFTFFTPLPGCELYDTIDQYGRFDNDWKKASMWNPVFVPDGITENQLVKYWKRASMGFYLRPRIIFSYARKVRSWRLVKVYLLGILSLFEATFIKKYAGKAK